MQDGEVAEDVIEAPTLRPYRENVREEEALLSLKGDSQVETLHEVGRVLVVRQVVNAHAESLVKRSHVVSDTVQVTRDAVRQVALAGVVGRLVGKQGWQLIVESIGAAVRGDHVRGVHEQLSCDRRQGPVANDDGDVSFRRGGVRAEHGVLEELDARYFRRDAGARRGARGGRGIWTPRDHRDPRDPSLGPIPFRRLHFLERQTDY